MNLNLLDRSLESLHEQICRLRAGPGLLRQQTVEPVFGVIKAVLGFAEFSLRGLDKVAGEWDLVALAYNCKRRHKLKPEMTA